MKKIFLALMLFAVLSPAVANAVDFESFYTVAADGDTAPKNSFSFDQKPFLYLKLPDQGGAAWENFNIAGTIWRDPSDTPYGVAKDFDDTLEAWLSFDNWDDIKQRGLWNVNGGFFFANTTTGDGSATFTVTPEPVSMTLFGLGAGALGLNRLRRKKL